MVFHQERVWKKEPFDTEKRKRKVKEDAKIRIDIVMANGKEAKETEGSGLCYVTIKKVGNIW